MSLTCLGAGQLFEFAVKFFDLPTIALTSMSLTWSFLFCRRQRCHKSDNRPHSVSDHRLNPVYYTDASHQPPTRTAVPCLDQLDQPGITLVLYADVDDQERILGILDQPLD